MALLKKIQSASLIEALVATILIVIIFIVASLVLNNLIKTNYSHNTHAIENHICELQYLAKHKKLLLPYSEDFGEWSVDIKADGEMLHLLATNNENNTVIAKEDTYAP